MRILVLSQYYVPESGAPQNRWHDLTQRLSAMGHKVSVLTGMPNYPAGRIFDGYRGKAFCRDWDGPIRVYRTWLYATPSKSMAKRMINYLSFGFMALWMGSIFVPRQDLLIWESPPLFCGPFAWLLAKLKRARCVMNVSDLWPESAVALGMVRADSRGVKMSEKLERWLYRHSDAVTGQTEGIVESIRRRTPGLRVQLFPNGVDLGMFSPAAGDAAAAKKLGLEGRFVVGYGGIIGYAQALGQVLDAAELLKDRPEALFAFFGDGPEKKKLQAQVRQRGLDNVRFFDRQDRTRMPGIIALWDVGLVPLSKNPLFLGARPSKMFELMGQAKPILFCGGGEAAEIIRGGGCGVVVEPEAPEQLAAVVRDLLARRAELPAMGQRGYRLAVDKFDRAKIAILVSQFLESV